jgi:hypothetical protein
MNGVLMCAVLFAIDIVGLKLLEPFGWGNLAAIQLLCSWYLIDGRIPRRRIYGSFGLSEPYLRHEIRFWRAIALLVFTLMGVGVTLVSLLRTSQASNTIPAGAAIPVAGIITAFLASFGVLLTRFEQSKADRTKASLDAIREQMYGAHLTKIYSDVRKLTSECQKAMGLERSHPLPTACMTFEQVDHESGPKPPDGKTLSYNVDQFFNALNQLALGVRLGHLDHTTIELLLRPRYIQFSFIFFEYIKQETSAQLESNGRWRSQKRTWEHMLWLTSKLPMLKADGTDWDRIVMPPDHIVGTHKDELLRPPPTTTSGPLNLEWDLIDSAMRKLAGR